MASTVAGALTFSTGFDVTDFLSWHHRRRGVGLLLYGRHNLALSSADACEIRCLTDCRVVAVRVAHLVFRNFAFDRWNSQAFFDCVDYLIVSTEILVDDRARRVRHLWFDRTWEAAALAT